jgi:hypothetical protein
VWVPRTCALAGGADETGARLWPLSVDGLVLLATVGLLGLEHRSARRNRWALWAAFGFGTAVSLAAASLGGSWCWPPVALLLAVELIAHHRAAAPPALVAGSDQRAAEPAFSSSLGVTGVAGIGERPRWSPVSAGRGAKLVVEATVTLASKSVTGCVVREWTYAVVGAEVAAWWLACSGRRSRGIR